MANQATGVFNVKLEPVPAEGSSIGRMSIAKKFQGDLEADSKGQMLAFHSPIAGSAGYVAMEQVSGTLDGRAGTFVLQHSGTMNRGEPRLSVTVVPDSGTGELAGLEGTMQIDPGKHSYVFDFTLPEAD